MILLLSILLLIFPFAHAEERALVSYGLAPGRLGDQLVAFSHGLWFSHVLGLPLKFTPFPQSEYLHLHTSQELIREEFPELQKLCLVSREDYLHFFHLLATHQFSKGFLFEVPYYPDGNNYLFEGRWAQFTHIDWKDPEFLKRLRALISPSIPIPKQDIPENSISVALHYRSGEGYDDHGWQWRFALKGPPDLFYEEALRVLHGVVRQPLYIFIFTDSPNPIAVRQKFEQRLSDLPLTFACRAEENSHYHNVIEDFFAFKEFDCLIRPESNFSLMASRLFPFKIVVSPAHFERGSEGVVIDQIQLDFAPTERVGHSFRTILHREFWKGNEG